MKQLQKLSYLLFVLAAVTSCDSSNSSDPTPTSSSVHLTLGNPSGAVADVKQPTNYLLVKPQYVLSYHRDRGIPNWVSWHLDKSWRGSAARQDDFRADEALPAGWYRVQASSYTGSGFDRGHNCPSADRTKTAADNSATFLMTNMMPQAPRSNQQTWARLEEYCRSLVNDDKELYILCGSYGRGGTGANGGVTQTIDDGHVTVPRRCWKVIVVLPTGDNDVARVSTSTRVIAIDTPNDNSISSNWEQYRVSVDAIEAATGLDLLSAVSTSVQSKLESTVDTGPTE
ncbi:DNA/RNA non-specific endonuclease [Hymenobacter wooponensis]|uniref:DNA/RNA non-specific endonuclease n=1 Tax=Hymenobacter wooponensis TaxID=1525360 RepID=A0A4Z0MMB4_9BACT|nr:DNA/RNA non-specific endonuclease [Hymenobacter wooponensis]TGD80559.1 DNA/RNA non-specific endonuclease [Hymenobacter wooponensis]